MPRFVRTLLLLTSLGLLLLPSTRTVGANQQAPDLVGEVIFSLPLTCTTLGNLSHERCVGSVLVGGGMFLTVKRADNSAAAVCTGNVDEIPLTTRETEAEGRGRVGPIHVVLDEDVGVNNCRVRLEGRFHRIGTVAVGRLTLDIHRADSTFRHTYCARFLATEDPVAGMNIEIEGYESPACAGSDPDTDGTHGRRPDDGNDPLHHDTCVDEITLSCTALPSVATLAPTYVSNDCNEGTNVVDGFVEGGYLKLRSAQSGGQTFLCAAVDAGGIHVGGKVTVAGGTPTTKTLAQCQDSSNDPYRTFHRDGSAAGQPYWVDVISKPGEVWVCAFYAGLGSGLAVPTSAVPSFAQDPLATFSYDETAAPEGHPSSDCQSLSGTKTRLLNAQVASAHVWAYTRQSGSLTQLCARAEQPSPSPSQAAGVRVSLDSAGSQTFVTSSFPASDAALLPPTGPCDFDIITDTSAFPELIVRTRDPGSGSPAYVCLRVAETRLLVKADAGGSQSFVGVSQD